MTFNYRLKFEKVGNMRFIGHLDTQALFTRCIKLAGLPIAYSHGFHERQQLTFALPLSLGMASISEYADITLTQPQNPQLISALLNKCFPQGITILNTRLLLNNERPASKVVCAAAYEVSLENNINIDRNISNFLDSKEVILTKSTKKSEKLVNIRTLVYSVSATNNKFCAILAAGVDNLKPKLLLEYLKYNKEDSHFIRTEIFKKSENSSALQPLWETKV